MNNWIPRSLPRPPVLLLGAAALLAACDKDAVEIAQEIEAARGECTQQLLKQGDPRCVEMMERYADMGVDVIETYIGAVKAMDEALRRMPPPQFDTVGIGRALTLPPDSLAAADTRLGARGGWQIQGDPSRSATAADTDWQAWQRSRAQAQHGGAYPEVRTGAHTGGAYVDPRGAAGGGWAGAPYGGGYDPREYPYGYGDADRWSQPGRGYGPGHDVGYAPGYGYEHGPGYDPRDPYGAYGAYGGWSDAAAGSRGYDARRGPRGARPGTWSAPAPRYDRYGRPVSDGRYPDPRSARRPAAREARYRGGWYEEEDAAAHPDTAAPGALPPVPERGQLLPPEQRLRRPWIRHD